MVYKQVYTTHVVKQRPEIIVFLSFSRQIKQTYCKQPYSFWPIMVYIIVFKTFMPIFSLSSRDPNRGVGTCVSIKVHYVIITI